MNALNKFRDTLVLLIVMGLGTIALGEAISNDLHLPGARIIAAECQGFEALATAGGKLLTCDPQADETGEHAAVAAPVAALAADART